jgi:co-chaperonin GroES (HSP10)
MAFNQLGNDIDGENSSDNSGESVSISSDGSIVAIGAQWNDSDGTNRGHTRIYSWNGSSWSQLGVDIDGEGDYDNSGHSVSLSADGTIVAIGAKYNDGNDNYNSVRGNTRIYSWNGSSWIQLGTDINGRAAGDNSGFSVQISNDGSTVAIGAPESAAGHTGVFRWNGSNWNQLGSYIEGEAAYDEAGSAVALSDDGSIVAIGAPWNDETGDYSGQTRIYSWDGSNWSQLGADIDGEVANDKSGSSVSLSDDGTVVAIGAPDNDGNGSYSGHTRIYSWDGSNWSQLGADIDGEDAGDLSGSSVSLSDDGKIVAIGAPNNDGSNGDNSGHVRIYAWNGIAWVQSGSDIDGEVGSRFGGDESGNSVALSSDGKFVAIGAPKNGSDAGHVRVFDLEDPTIAISSDVSSLKAGETAALTFTLSESSSDFIESDIAVSGGTLSSFSGSGTTYTATFTPTADSTTNGVISVASSKFSDAAGNTNNDGSEANNKVTLSIDTTRPTIDISSDVTTLKAGETANLTFTLSEPSSDFVASDITATGGALSSFSGSGTAYTAIFTPTADSTTNGVISVASTKFSDAAGNTNNDGSDSNNTVNLSVDTTVSSLNLNDNNTFTVSTGSGDGLWIKLTVNTSKTDFQNSLIIKDQNEKSLAAIGATHGNKNLGKHQFFVAEGSTISFHQFTNGKAVNSSPQIGIIKNDDGTFQLSLNDGSSPSDLIDDLIIDISTSTTSSNPAATALATEQDGIYDAILNFATVPEAGTKVKMTIDIDCAFDNTFAMVKLTEEGDGTFSVAGISNTAGDSFDLAVKDNLINPRGSITKAQGVTQKTLEWSISSTEAGYYAPVIINPDGKHFTYGSNHVKTFGHNHFGFEDTLLGNSSDFDYNDVSILFEIV